MIDSPGLYRSLLDNLQDGVYLLDSQRRIVYWNKSAERLTGYAAAEVLGRSCAESILTHINAKGCCLCEKLCPVAAVLADSKPREAEVYLHHKEGHRVSVYVRVAAISDASGTIIGALQVFCDNRAELAARYRLAAMQKSILLDPLTGLGNRRYAEMGLESRLFERRQFGMPLGVIFADIDCFKCVNDTHGHACGDRVLQMVGRTLGASARDADIVARWGGEEFIVILQVDTEGQMRSEAERLREFVSQTSLEIGGHTIRPTVSIGATMAVSDDTAETVVCRADQLMYRSKMEGRNCVTA